MFTTLAAVAMLALGQQTDTTVTVRPGMRLDVDNFGGGISIMLPVRNRNEGNIAAAMAGARAAERRIEFTVLTVRQEVAAAFAQYEAAQRSVDLYERGVRDVARRNLDVVRQAYRLGRGSLLDVVAEQRRYIEIESGYTDALKQVYDAAVDIERAVGVAGR